MKFHYHVQKLESRKFCIENGSYSLLIWTLVLLQITSRIQLISFRNAFLNQPRDLSSVWRLFQRYCSQSDIWILDNFNSIIPTVLSLFPSCNDIIFKTNKSNITNQKIIFTTTIAFNLYISFTSSKKIINYDRSLFWCR